MNFSLVSKKKKNFNLLGKTGIFLAGFLLLTTMVMPLKPAQAQLDLNQAIANIENTFLRIVARSLQKAGSIAFQRTLSTALNKIAYDAANYIAASGSGQKPLYITQDFGDYMSQIGDEAAGTFVESFVNNLNTAGMECGDELKKCQENCKETISGDLIRLQGCFDNCDKQNTACASGKVGGIQSDMQASPSFNVCSPSSLEAKLKISLGLIEQTRAPAPNCTASEMVKTWQTDINKKITDLQNKDYLDDFSNIFNPVSNDLGIYLLARTDLSSKAIIDTENANTKFTVNKGWADVTDAAGSIVGIPGQAERQLDQAQAIQEANFGRLTGDILVDSANVFLNQLSIAGFNRLMQELGKKTKTAGSVTAGLVGDEEGSPQYSVGNVKEITRQLIQPKFDTQANYDILVKLSSCINKDNPGPTDCVIDSKFMQGISEKQTVAEALENGYLHGDWQFTLDSKGDSYNNSYTERNIAILRKYRILPVGWEKAVSSLANKSVKATLNDLVSCFDPGDGYAQFSSEFDTRDQAWCQGLIDPNWVLKAPLNYCAKEGVGAQIIGAPSITPLADGSGGISSEVNILRAEEYCADEQSCIKEKDNGDCEVYGYCNQEKRVWSFEADSCEPIYNTCQAFTNAVSGQTVAYLENTLDYGTCNPETSGCRQYSLSGDYAVDGTIAWNGLSSLYLNKNLGTCRAQDEGCTELMRVKPTWGTNLVKDADFANEEINDASSGGLLHDWYVSGSAVPTLTVVDAAKSPGGLSGKAMKVVSQAKSGRSSTANIVSNAAHSLLPDNFQTIFGQAYTVSVDVYLANADIVRLFAGPEGDGFIAPTTVKNSWQHLTITRPSDLAYSEPNFTISGAGSGQVVFYIKNLKFEVGGWDTDYNSYGYYSNDAPAQVYEKLLPAYLEEICYVNATGASKDYRLKNDAPAVCDDYARRCNKDEVGCELFSSVNDIFSVPAKALDSDYCRGECLNYDVYVTKESYFNSPRVENLIPETATVCKAEAAGCNEFTNLDALTQGGEQKEYYTSLKQCIKPSVTACASFYSWEGRGDGYQLKAYSLKKTAAGLPAVTADDSSLCNATIYNLPVNHPDFNPDCREFYNVSGAIAYHLLSRVITCSEDCHPYRLSEKNIDSSLNTSRKCAMAGRNDRYWDAATGDCYVCLNGGVWDNVNKACTYLAIPGEGQTCRASENGCREYNGNNGSNVRLIASYDFENGLGSWHSNCVGGVALSTIANSKDGHSLQYTDISSCGVDPGGNLVKTPLIKQILANEKVVAQIKVSGLVREKAAYSLKFLARAANQTSVQIYFLNPATDAVASFTATPLVLKAGNEWNVYQVNLAALDHAVGENEILAVSGSDEFYLDNLILSEITDRYYLLEESSQVPDTCYYDIFDDYQGSEYNLGCSQYTDRGGLKHNLRKFTQLCSDSAVGCEQMIETKNYTSPDEAYWLNGVAVESCDTDDQNCVAVAADSAVYAVYDPSRQCHAADLGCSRLGEGQVSSQITAWSDVFKRNNPNQYEQILCGPEDVGCEEWRDARGDSSYFKNPGFDACLYRTSRDPNISGKAWYKVPVKRCDSNGDGTINGAESGTAICAGNTDCGDKACVIDNNDYPCSVSYFKTIGWGGSGNQIPTPDQAVGLCEPAAAGCSEYIDPVSQFSVNSVANPSYQLTNEVAEGWGNTSGNSWNKTSLNETQQVIALKQNKLYSLSVSSNTDSAISGMVELDFSKTVRPLLADNTLGTATLNLEISDGLGQPIIFNSLNNSLARLSGGKTGITITVKELIIDYQHQESVNKTDCNGTVKLDNGCVLFNERVINGAAGLADLSTGWDAYATADGASPEVCDSTVAGSCTANQLIKVRPDRVCASWLDCVTYGLDAAGQKVCYALGECDRLDDKNECQHFVDPSETALTHQFDVNTDKNSAGYALLDRYYLGNMKEVGLDTEAHFDFETNDGSAPNGLFVLEPVEAPTDYPAHGRGYLGVPAKTQVTVGSSLLVEEGSYYYLNYLLNTKGTVLSATVTIQDADSEAVIAEFIDSARNGWERKVHRLNTGAHRNIKIVLSSDTTVYFDDINIEPVLQIANTGNEAFDYVAKDCRLYPNSTSLTCTSFNNNVVEDGLYGYCLQYDPLNPKVCAMWYPVDKLGFTGRSSQTLGYNGKFPLYYCTEADGDFQLVKKVQATAVKKWLDNEKDDCTGNACWDLKNRVGASFGCDHSDSDSDDYERYVYLKDALVEDYCVDTSSYKLISSREVSSNNKVRYVLYCVPKGDSSTRIAGPTILANQSNMIDMGDIADSSACVDEIEFLAYAWVPYSGSLVVTNLADDPPDDTVNNINESTNYDPPIAVFKTGMNHEGALKFFDTDDEDKQFKIQCNRFTQLVDSAGNNKAWVERVGPSSSLDNTPQFFLSYYGNILKYGRNREDVPFGAAILPSDTQLVGHAAINLRSQYSEANDILAGRPYGCSYGEAGCVNIGQCSGNLNVFCIYDPNTTQTVYEVNDKSCGDYGVCQRLWTTPLQTDIAHSKADNEKVLRNIFYKQYSHYSYLSSSGYQSASASASDLSFTWVGGSDSDAYPSLCSPTDSRVNPNSFCSVLPQIANVKMNGLPLSNGSATVKSSGVYVLSFNTTVDKEQQPLDHIVIDWGDNSGLQSVTGEDHRPDIATPHAFYHYYIKRDAPYIIKIKIVDNWDRWRCYLDDCP